MVLLPSTRFTSSLASEPSLSEAEHLRSHVSITSPPPVNIAIFGVGRWGTHLLRNFANHPQANVVAVVDPCPDRLRDISQQFQLDGAILTNDAALAMHHPDVTAVAIATPAATHYPLIRTALQTGLHVLAEKPLTLDTPDALELCC
ncbi:MAG TPA: Gfo/Idh/MocA family oxidoreductase, partial [Coleofasciculaceae cyanobacterium]